MAEVVFMSPEGWSTLTDEIELQAERQIAELEGNLKDVPHRVLIQKGKISDVLGEIISENAIDLVVLGTTDERALASWSLVLRPSKFPVVPGALF